MKVLKNSLFLLVFFVFANLVFALYFYNTQIKKININEVERIKKDCRFATDFYQTCVYMQVRNTH